MIGKTLAHYEITSQIGKGGMGEVYQAKDTKLGRDVAIKVLPEEFARDADRVARFQREAKLLASLNHPNIAAIYGLEESDGTHFLVMELIEGQTLADRIKTGSIPVEEALKLALQIAEALEAAHEKGVIHRDLKPANIKVTPDGKGKVLDFGLAKAYAGEQDQVSLSNSPTLSDMATQQGLILGTAAYMSPEQARGKPVDKRTDVWAFGCVLYEMLTRQAAFQGEDVTEILAAVVKSSVNMDLLPANIHPRISEVLIRCLQKEQKKRYGGIGEAQYEIERVLADPSGVFAQPSLITKSRKQFRVGIPWVAAVFILGLIIAGLAVWKLKPSEPRQVTRFYYELPEDQRFGYIFQTALAVSPDGSQFVYRTEEGLFLRSMDKLIAKPILGAEEDPRKPFFSPDGKWVGYLSGTEDILKKVSIDGGAPIPITDEAAGGFVSWGVDNMIVYCTFGSPGSIKRISANGGNPEVLVDVKEGCSSPQMLPDGKTVMFTLGPGPSKIMVQSLESLERKEITDGDSACYVPTGHILYARDNDLFAVPFDTDTLEVTGGSVSMVQGLFKIASIMPQYAISNAGTLAYILDTGTPQSQLEWYSREGNSIGTVGNPDIYQQFSLSFDEKRIVIEQKTELGFSLWVMDLDRGGVGKKITSGNFNDRDPIWSPDGRYIYFKSDRNDSVGLYRKLLVGDEEPELFFKSDGNPVPEDCSDDGRFIMYGNHGGIYVLPLDDILNPIIVVPKSDSNAYDEPKFSPDAEWIAYVSNESGRDEVYIKPLKRNIEKRRISTQGGSQPQWRIDGKEIYYLALDGNMMAVELKGETLIPGNPTRLFQTGLIVSGSEDQYAVTRDGQKFLINNSDSTKELSSIIIVLNWFEELKDRVPVE
jgi:serine/threonine protein kinase/Tol biopolymer transport system component